jgi:hypothetical protein
VEEDEGRGDEEDELWGSCCGAEDGAATLGTCGRFGEKTEFGDTSGARYKFQSLIDRKLSEEAPGTNSRGGVRGP